MLQQMQQMAQQRGAEGMRPPGMGGGMDQAYQQRMQQMQQMGRGMEGGINGLQKPPMPPAPGGGAPMFLGDQGIPPNATPPPPPAAATGASPGGPLSGRNFNQGFGGQRGFGMGRFGGYGGRGGMGGRGMGGGGAMPPGVMPTPAGSDGIAGLQPQGYATGGKVSWSPVAQGNSMFTNMGQLPAITKPAAYVAPATNTAIWQPPAAAAAAATKPNYSAMNMQGGGYWARDPNILPNGVRFGGSGSHGGGRG
jgi:hypothetical protein